MKCVLESVRTLPNGKTLMRCTVCRKERPAKNPARLHMQCGVGLIKPGGPGTELRKIFAELGVKPGRGCQCKAYARKMDGWGPSGCRARHAEIVAHLQAKAESFGLAAWAAAGWAAVWQGKPWTIGGLVSLAIERANALQPF